MPNVDKTRAKHQELTAQLARLMMKRERAIEQIVRIETKATGLKRAIARSQKRLDKLLLATYSGGPTASAAVEVIQQVETRSAAAPLLPNDDIPDFLRRGLNAQSAVDRAVAESIAAEQAERKTAKSRGRIAPMKADRSGERKRMPLQGKAALAAINAG